jgi:hypothetical protein
MSQPHENLIAWQRADALHFAKRVGYLKSEAWRTIDAEVRKTASPLLGLARQQSNGGA